MQSRLYEFSQRLLGSTQSDRRLKALLNELPSPRVVLDVGGGTGLSEPLIPSTSLYVCLDMARDRLGHFIALHPGRWAVQADAAHLPFASRSVDLLLCRGVFHHLNDTSLELLLRDARRVVGPRGRLAWLEPVWSSRWLPGRALWLVDEGSHPRDRSLLRASIESNFDVDVWDEYAIYHRYSIGLGRARAG
jgi:ubiquinone/menaquinone biosynthesis C-methylase UbiE